MSKISSLWNKLSGKKQNSTPEELVQQGVASAPNAILERKEREAFNFAVECGLIKGLDILEAKSREKNTEDFFKALRVNNTSGYVELSMEIPSYLTNEDYKEKEDPDKTTQIRIEKKEGFFRDYFKVTTSTMSLTRISAPYTYLYKPKPIVERDSCSKTLKYIAKRAREQSLV